MRVGRDDGETGCSHEVCSETYVHDDHFEDGCIWRVTHTGSFLVPVPVVDRMPRMYSLQGHHGSSVTVADGTKGMQRGI